MRFLHHLNLVSFLFPLLAIADVRFQSPAPGSSYAAGAALPISWTESGQAPLLSQLTNYVINLCAGGNAAGSFQCSLGVLKAGGAFTAGNVVAGVIVQPGWGQNVVDGLYVYLLFFFRL